MIQISTLALARTAILGTPPYSTADTMMFVSKTTAILLPAARVVYDLCYFFFCLVTDFLAYHVAVGKNLIPFFELCHTTIYGRANEGTAGGKLFFGLLVDFFNQLLRHSDIKCFAFHT